VGAEKGSGWRHPRRSGRDDPKRRGKDDLRRESPRELCVHGHVRFPPFLPTLVDAVNDSRSEGSALLAIGLWRDELKTKVAARQLHAPLER